MRPYAWMGMYINVCIIYAWRHAYSMFVCVYLSMYVYGYTRMYLYARVGVNRVYMFICMCWLRATTFRVCSVRSEPSFRILEPDPDSCSLWTRYIGNPKTDPWNDPYISTGSCSEDQTAIHFRNRIISVSVRSCAIAHLPLSVCIYLLHLSFHVTFFYVLPVWFLVLLHETSMIVHFNYIVDRNLYQYHFMCW